MDSLTGDVQLREILIDGKQFKIYVLGLLVKVMIIVTQEG